MQVRPDVLFSVANFPVTNAVAATIISDVVVVLFVLAINRVVSLEPTPLQNAVEMVIDYFIKITEEIAGERASFICPWVLSFFIFMLISNLIAQLPGFELIILKMPMSKSCNKVPLLRAASTDLNFTLALAVISVVVTHYLSIKCAGIKAYFTRFITFRIFPVFLFVGILEFLNEITKIISFSFRLFGNILSGERIMATMYGIFPLGLPLPFMLLEFLVAIIQAMIFAMLTLVFMHIMTDKPHTI
ncbi:MAG: F0F1 ATP synthase subunit A [Endomicrobium sp.]|jgi:F-type H+-transporting ATPase subunit a|nr:F0F1 ATP synthase subunit A [Endomicrobium sp.]